MAITSISALAVTAAVAPSASTEIVATGPIAIHADNLQDTEFIEVWRLGPSGGFLRQTVTEGMVRLSKNPNTVYLEVANTYRLSKTETAVAPAVGYEAQ